MAYSSCPCTFSCKLEWYQHLYPVLQASCQGDSVFYAEKLPTNSTENCESHAASCFNHLHLQHLGSFAPAAPGPMWYITGPKLAQRAARHAWVGTGSDQQAEAYGRAGDERYPLDVQDFMKLLRRNYGTLVRAWRVALDKDSGSELEFCEFVAAVRQMGAGQNARSLWFNLDVDQSGTLSLYDLDPTAAHALDKFRYLCTSQYGSIQNAFANVLDLNKSGMIDIDEFIECMEEMGYDAAAAQELFGFLRPRPGARLLKSTDLDFLQKWENAKQEKKEKAGTLQVGWVNRDPCAAWQYRQMAEKLAASKGKDGKEGHSEARTAETPFTAAAVAIAKAAAHAAGNVQDPPKVETETLTPRLRSNLKRRVENSATAAAIAKAQEKIGCYCMRLASDNETPSSPFLQYLLDRFKSLAAAWDAMDPQHTGEITRSNFASVVVFKLCYCKKATEARRLFEALPKKEGHRITWRDLGLTAEEWLEFSTEKNWNLLQKRLDAQKKRAGDGARKALQSHYERSGKKGPQIKLVFGEKPPEFHDNLPKWWPTTSRPLSAR